MNKEEFYKFVTKDGWGYDIIEADADGLWVWIEKYGDEQRIDECKKWHSDMLRFDLRLDSFVIRLDDYCENRIKELK